MTDYLAHWWRHEVTIEPKQAGGFSGSTFGSPASWQCAIDDRRKLVRDADGNEVVSETQLYGPIDSPDFPLGSRVTLPATHGSRVTTIISVAHNTSGGLPTPDHVEVVLA